MWLIAGLGNPGAQYARQRHNVGFVIVEELARRYGTGPFRARFGGELAEGRIGADKVLLLRPLTYMNESGRSVGQAMRFFKVPLDRLVVVHDELDLRPGKIRIKQGGGAGGHNGIRSIDSHLGPGYWRVRIGIGHPGDKDRVHGYVLSDFAKAEQSWLEPLVDAVAEAFPLFLAEGPPAMMTKVALLTQPEKPERPPRRKGAPQAGQEGDGPAGGDAATPAARRES